MQHISRRILTTLLLTLSAYTVCGQVTAGFTASHYSGCAPLLVSFTNTTTPSTGNTYLWDLGNGSGPDTLTNPGTSYTSAGSYTVTLTAFHGLVTSTATTVITVYPAPVVSFNASDTQMCPGVPSTYTSTGTTGVPGTAIYSWSFGDGYSGMGTPITHAIGLPGHFNITLSVTNVDGCTTLLTRPGYIHVLTPPATAFSVSATHICPNTNVVFNSTATTGTTPFTYTWNFGDGSPASTLPGPNHVYTAPGLYNVHLTVTDIKSCEDSLVMPGYINVSNMVASFTGPDTACTKTNVTFTNTSTAYLSDTWLFGDGVTSTLPNGHHRYDTTGTFTVKLVTYNGYCYDTVSRHLYIPPPASGFTFTPIHPCPPPALTTYVATVPTGATVLWSFGDSSLGAGITTTHTYTTYNYDTIKMFETYAIGCKDTLSKVDTVYDLVFSEASTPMGGCIPVTTTFVTYAYTSLPPYYPAPPGPYPYHYALSYSWDFGDGSPPGTGAGPTHTYTAVGIFPVKLTVTSSNGCVFVFHDTMRAGTPPHATFTATPNHECYKNNLITFTRTLVSGPVTGFLWRFGEGNYLGAFYDTVTTPIRVLTHHFALPGFFSDTLISYYNGCPDTFVRHNYVLIDSPISISYTRYPCIAKEVEFQNFSLGDDTHLWSFGDGATSTLDTVFHTYPSYGSYYGMLTTYNIASGCRDTEELYIDLTKLAFNFSTPDTAICRDNYLKFTSTILAGYADYYYWNSTGSHSIDTNNATYVDTFHITGRYTIQLIVLDQYLCPDTLTRTNYILVAKPVAHFTVSPPNTCWPHPTTLTDVSTDQPGTFMANHWWDFGDSTFGVTGAPSIIHTFTNVGTYNTTEIVTDNIGCKDTITSALVNLFHPMASFTQSTTHTCAYSNVSFTNTSTPPGASFHWYFGDGLISTIPGPTHSYADTGHFTIMMVMTNPEGCTDTAKGYIRITKPHAVFKMDDSIAICPPFTVNFTNLSSGGFSNLWNLGNGNHSLAASPTNLYTVPGYDTVMLVVTDTAGCKDTATGHVKIYGYAGAFSYSPDSGCVPLTILFNTDLTNMSIASSIVWDFSDGTTISASGSDTISHTYLLPGTYIPKLIVADSVCSASNLGIDTIRVDRVNPGFTTIPNTVCPGDTVILTDTSTSYWSHITGRNWIYNGTATSILSPHVVYTTGGIYTDTLHVTDGWGCTATAYRTVTVNPLPDAGTITSNLVNAFCIGYKFEVQDTTSGGTWSFSNGHVTLSGDTITAISPGEDTLYYTVTNSCGTAIAIDSFFVPPPLPAVTGNPVICVGDTTRLTDSVQGGGWIGGYPTVTLNTFPLFACIVKGESAGVAIITYYIDLGCTTTTAVTVNPLPNVTSTVSPIKCYGENNASITLTPGIGNPPYQYQWSNGATAPSINALSPGTYTVIVKDTALLCRVKDTFQITMPDSIMITDSINNDICFAPNGSISITATGGTTPYRYEWSNSATGNEIRGLASGKYSLILTDGNGCLMNYFFLLADSACPYIIIYNAISPNGDGINDTWVIEHIQNYPGNTVYVFDKWGDEIFTESDYKNDWYGMGKNGKLVPDGTYYYLVKLNTDLVPGGKNVFKGTLLIKH